MIGLSEKLLHQFVEYMANRRMKGIRPNTTVRTKNKSTTVGRPLVELKRNAKRTTRNRDRKLCDWWC